jgi:hypothetical protein
LQKNGSLLPEVGQKSFFSPVGKTHMQNWSEKGYGYHSIPLAELVM